MFDVLQDSRLFYSTAMVLPAWGLLVLFPGARLARTFSFAVMICLALLYALVLVGSFVDGHAGSLSPSDFTTLSAFAKLIGHSDIAFVVWVHHLLSSLYLGTWISWDAVVNRVPCLFMVPCLLFTMAGGMLGLPVYNIIQSHHHWLQEGLCCLLPCSWCGCCRQRVQYVPVPVYEYRQEYVPVLPSYHGEQQRQYYPLPSAPPAPVRV